MSNDQRFRSGMVDRRLYLWHEWSHGRAHWNGRKKRRIEGATSLERDLNLLVRTLWDGLYRHAIPDATLAYWTSYLVQSESDPDPKAVQEIFRMYWAGEYKPRESETLDAQLDFALGLGEKPEIFTDAVKNGKTVNMPEDDFSDLL
jgi:hypothetical protein